MFLGHLRVALIKHGSSDFVSFGSEIGSNGTCIVIRLSSSEFDWLRYTSAQIDFHYLDCSKQQ